MKSGANRPVVTAHFAMTADGKTSTRAFALFTSPADKLRLQQLQAGADAVMADGDAVATDSMSLGLPREGLRRGHIARGLAAEPLRVIVSNSGNLDPGWKAFNYSGSPPIVFSTRRMPARVRSAVARKAELFLFSSSAVDLRKSLEILRAEFAVKQLVCEGGGTLLRSLASLDLVDRICLTIAPVIFGGRLAPTLTGLPDAFLEASREFVIAKKSVVSGECILELRRKKCTA